MEINSFKTKIKHRLETTGWYVYRYRKIYMLVILLVALFEAIMIISALANGRYVKTRHIVYLVAYSILFVTSVTTGIILFFVGKKKNSAVFLSFLVHIYCTFIVAWSTIISCADITIGNYPIVYLTILMAVGGLVAINPIYYIFLIGGSLPFILAYTFKFKDLVTYCNIGGMFNLGVFLIMAFILSFRMYFVTFSESKIKLILTKSNNTDPLTGLGNERKYFMIIDEVDKNYRNYAVVMMDLNGLKVTNDAYGHRYGCHLVVEFGHRLSSYFPNSELFHIGGDEFVAVVIGDDFTNIESIMARYDNELAYSEIEYEGVKLILSSARGVAIKEEDENYNQVFQRADELMYINKKEIKEKYNIASRKQ